MVKIFLGLALLVAVGWGQEIPRGKAARVGLSQKKLDRLGAAMKKLVAKNKVPGMVTLVAKRGKIVHFQAAGWMELGKKKRLKEDAIFRLASMTKPITAVALMLLWEEKKFGLDEPVSKYLLSLEGLKVLEGGVEVAAKREMTIRDLLTHTAGFAYGYGLGSTKVDGAYTKANVLDANSTLEEMVAKLSEIPLAYHPGEKWAYSVSCDVQARLVEVLTGERFDEVLRKRIFEPLDLKDTAYFVPKNKLSRLPSAHYGPNLLPRGKPEDALRAPKLLAGGHGLYSTARDYLRFAEMMRAGGKLGKIRLLRAKTVAMMMKNQIPENLVPIAVGSSVLLGQGFGFGGAVQVKETFRKRRTRGRYGWAGAMTTTFLILPKDEIVALAFSQVAPYSNEVMAEFEKLVLAARKSPKKQKIEKSR